MTTLNLQVTTTGANDGFSYGTTFNSSGADTSVGEWATTVYSAFYLFTGVSGLSGATITAAIFSLYIGASAGSPLTKVYADDAESPAAPTTAADHQGRVRTTAGVDWDGPLPTGQWNESPEAKAVIQELATSYDPDTILLLHDNDGGDDGYYQSKTYDFNTTLAAKLDIDYTAGGVTVTPPTATLTTATFAPVIKLVVIPPKRTLSLATFTPVLGLSVIPPPLALSLTTFAPTVTATANITVTPGVIALSLTAFAPTITATTNVTVIPGVIALSLTIFAPTITTTGDVVVTPGTVALSLAMFAPVIKLVVTPPTLALNLQTFAPTISTPRLVTPPTATLSLAAFAPTVSAPRLVTPGVVNLSISAFAPTVTVTANVIVTPGVLTLSLGLFAPTVFTPRLVTPGLVALSLTAFIPTITVAAAFMAVWLDSGSVTLLLVLDGSVSLPQAVNDGTISIKETEDATV